MLRAPKAPLGSCVDLAGHFQFNPLCFPRNPDESAIPSLLKVAEIIGLLGEELAFVAPDQDAGILPINRLVMDLEELPEKDFPPS